MRTCVAPYALISFSTPGPSPSVRSTVGAFEMRAIGAAIAIVTGSCASVRITTCEPHGKRARFSSPITSAGPHPLSGVIAADMTRGSEPQLSTMQYTLVPEGQ